MKTNYKHQIFSILFILAAICLFIWIIFSLSNNFQTQTSSTENDYLIISKKALNTELNDFTLSSSVNAEPGDILIFDMIIEPGNKGINNLTIKDDLSENLSYIGGLTINGLETIGDIISGINIETITAKQKTEIVYKVQVAPADKFPWGDTILTSSSTINSNEINTETNPITVTVNKKLVQGEATSVSTGLTNNFWADSFFLPIFVIISGLWLYFSGRAYKFADWLKTKR